MAVRRWLGPWHCHLRQPRCLIQAAGCRSGNDYRGPDYPISGNWQNGGKWDGNGGGNGRETGDRWGSWGGIGGDSGGKGGETGEAGREREESAMENGEKWDVVGPDTTYRPIFGNSTAKYGDRTVTRGSCAVAEGVLLSGGAPKSGPRSLRVGLRPEAGACQC